MKLIKGSSTPAAAPSTTTPAAVGTEPTSQALHALRRHAPVDPFAVAKTAGGEPAFHDVSSPAGLRDPFAQSGVATPPVTTPPVTPPPTQVLPSKIVIGTPGAGRHAVSGWILILASIPTAQGRSSATTTANKARNNGLTFVSVLNSSNRRPLRGGYWVVYTGPYPSLNAVNSAATHVHASGFGDAYIRQLIVYKSK